MKKKNIKMLPLKIVGTIIGTLLVGVFFSCGGSWGKCKEQNLNFRPHKVRHCNKSKIYWYYHNTPCDCNGVRRDLELDSHFGKTYRNYVQYYDNGEIVWGR